MFFTLQSNMKFLGFQLIRITPVIIQAAVLNWFSWNSHGWWESTHGWNSLFLETISKENVPPKLVFWLSFSRYGLFWRKKFQNRIRYPIFHKKGHIYFCRPTPHSLKIGHAPLKLFFIDILENIVVFFEKIVKRKIFETSFPTRKVILIFVTKRPSLPKQSCSFTNDFLQFFQHKLKKIYEVLLLESILIRKKILWRINFVLIKFLLNTLLFEKLRNEFKNP